MSAVKGKKWWQHLLIIPIMLIVDLLALIAAGILSGADLMHPNELLELTAEDITDTVPVFVLLAVLVCGMLTVILTLRALYLCIRSVVRSRRGLEPEESENELSLEPERKEVWRCFIPIIAEIPLAAAAVFICGYIEINRFYNNPSHVGFAIPVVTFLLTAVLLIFTVLLCIFCTIAAFIRDKRNKKAKRLNESL